MNQLLDRLIRPTLGDALLAGAHDSAVLDIEGTSVAFTTDGYTVDPLFFPGGDIGTLAVNGTVNDLLMAGAKPLYLSASFIVEEGLPIATLQRATASLAKAAGAAGVHIATGDTKVVDRGKADGIYITTAGIGLCDKEKPVHPSRIRPGDAILLSGDIGRHGIAIMATREGLSFEHELQSDCAPLTEPVTALMEADVDVHCMRDLTRGGLASALVELARESQTSFATDETAVPVHATVHAACEMLGLDPIHVANEGRFIAFVPASTADRALTALQSTAFGSDAAIIGAVEEGPGGRVTMRSTIGVERIVEMMSGEQLPRIC